MFSWEWIVPAKDDETHLENSVSTRVVRLFKVWDQVVEGEKFDLNEIYFFGWFSKKILKITALSIRLLLRLRPTAPNFPEYWFTNKFNMRFDSSAFNQDLQHVQNRLVLGKDVTLKCLFFNFYLCKRCRGQRGKRTSFHWAKRSLPLRIWSWSGTWRLLLGDLQ